MGARTLRRALPPPDLGRYRSRRSWLAHRAKPAGSLRSYVGYGATANAAIGGVD